GAGLTMYRPLAALLPTWVDVCLVRLPGREGRLRDPAITSMEALLDGLEEALLDGLEEAPRRRLHELPNALFGHSFGALIAFAWALRLEKAGTGPVQVLLSGQVPPGATESRSAFHRLPDASLISEVMRWGGVANGALMEPEIAALALPTLRADLRL